MEDHLHGEDGHMVEVPVAEEHVAEAEVQAEAAVEIAKIEADKEITLAKIEAREVPRDLEAELAAALGEIEGLKRQLAPPMPEVMPEPEPVVVVQDVETAPEPDAPPSHHEPEREPETPRKSSYGSKTWFG